MNKFKKISRLILINIFVVATIILAFFTGYLLIQYILFNPNNLSFSTSSSKIFDINNTLLWEISENNAVKNSPVKLEEISKYCLPGIVAIEDRTFWFNNGIDPSGVMRLISSSLFNGGSSGGGSTISQQLVKNYFQSIFNRGFDEKISEMLFAVKLNNVLSKSEILELYLNNIYFGNLNYGIESASQNYFGKSAKELSLSECAYLVGIPQWPGVYNPYGDLSLGLNRQKVVLQAMLNQNYISQEEYSEAISSNINLNLQESDLRAPHFVQFVDNLLSEQEGLNKYENLSIKTLYNYEIHSGSLGLLRSFLNENQNKNINNLSLVVLGKDNSLKTMIGSADYFNREIDGQFNSALGLRQPGSSLLPLVYSYLYSTSDNIVSQSEFDELIDEIDFEDFKKYLSSFSPISKDRSKCDSDFLKEGCEFTLLELSMIYSQIMNKNKVLNVFSQDNEVSLTSSIKLDNLLNEKYTQAIDSEEIDIYVGKNLSQKDFFAFLVDQNYTIGVWIGNTSGEEIEYPEDSEVFNLIKEIEKIILSQHEFNK